MRKLASWAVVAHAFNPSTREAEAMEDLSEFKAGLLYMPGSRPSTATGRELVSKERKEGWLSIRMEPTMGASKQHPSLVLVSVPPQG